MSQEDAMDVVDLSQARRLITQLRARAAVPLTINANSEFQIVLTKLGADAYNAYYWQFPADLRPAQVKPGDTLTDTLWHMMVIFGPNIHQGGDTPFEGNVVTLTQLR
jgi:hypothetical protein